MGRVKWRELQERWPVQQQLAPRDMLPFRATLDGQVLVFSTAEEKFNALANAWLNSQGGRARLDFSHEAYLQDHEHGASRHSLPVA